MMEILLDRIPLYLGSNSLLAFPASYLGGLLVSFTPCVYPVAPITIAFVGTYAAGSRVKCFWLSLLYVVGMAVTYAVLGGIAALSGSIFGQIQTNPWTLIFLANVCLLMGLSMLGMFSLPITMPRWVMKLQGWDTTRRGAWGGFLLGAASGLVIGPCTAPVLAVLLSYVATRQNMILGMSLLFVFALGMGTLLLVLGTFAGALSSLPRSGPWMVRVNRLFGCVLLGMAEYFLIEAGKRWL